MLKQGSVLNFHLTYLNVTYNFFAWKIDAFFALYLPGYMLSHHEELLNAYTSSLAPRTWANTITHMNVYLQFCLLHRVDMYMPSVYDIVSFLLFLKHRLKLPGVLVNYFNTKNIGLAQLKHLAYTG